MSTDAVDTSNKFMVASQGESCVFMRPLPRTMSKEDALNLAAYIVAMNFDDELWQRTLEAISNA